GGSISVGGGGVFKPGITPGNLVQQHMAGDTSFSAASSYFFLDNFQSSPGARLEIGGISLMPDIGPNSTVRGDSAIAEVFYPLIQFGTVPPSASNIAPSMTISNNLMEATLEFYEINDLSNPEPDPEKIDGVRLHITKVNNLSTLTGVGSYADVYRLIPTLSEAERDFLDHIYAVGGAYGEALGFLQTLGGAAINYSMLAMRHNLNQARRKIQRRNVDYQKEELAEKLAISSDQSYGSLIPSREGKGEETVYHGIWAYIDQSWMDQDDYGNLAGYRYNPYGIGIGYERHHDEWIFGGLLRYDDGTIKLKSQGGTRTDVQNLLFSAYASWASQGWYLNGSLEGGIGWNDSVSLFNLAGTPVVGRSGDYGTSVLGASLESGYMMDGYLWGNNLRMTPYGGLGYSRYDREGFRETGAGNLNRIFADGKTDIWEWSLGLRLAMPFEFGNFTLIPSFDAAWIHRMDDPRDNGNDVSLATAPGSAWRTDLFEGRNAAALSGGLSANFKSGLVLGAEFDLEMRKKAMGSRLGLNISRNF
ncbi:MAG: autotransporter outer membrane beta-barrel domain-containing protein, partial [Planctomycetota bacterium]|nr:autotransporter outer membrane beta-barrel domain-containing protein [Planctomycetota bacterium]